jgi:hypothetical protein
MTTPCHSLDAGPWHVRHRRIDRLGAWPFALPDRCQRCGRGLRYVYLLQNRDGERVGVGEQCARRLLEEVRARA